jgi:hypothetical protein
MLAVVAFSLLAVLAAADIPSRKPSLYQPRDPFAKLQSAGKHKGAWYFSSKGHAIFCYGPTKFVEMPEGGVGKVATFCRGDEPIVLLHD